MIEILILLLITSTYADDNCTQFNYCNDCVENTGISGNTCMWLVQSSNYICIDYSNLENNICNNLRSPYFLYCPPNGPIQDSPCSKYNNPLKTEFIIHLIIFVLGSTSVLNAASYAFYIYRYKKINPICGFLIGIIAPYFCWHINYKKLKKNKFIHSYNKNGLHRREYNEIERNFPILPTKNRIIEKRVR